MEFNESKKIIITGTSNRYQMKKVTQTKAPPKKRIIVESWDLDTTYFIHEKQLTILKKEIEFPLFFQQLERKIQGYKHQDIDKKVLDSEKFVTLTNVIQLLLDSQMTCYYCKEKVFVLYEMARENYQWTLDRIDNDQGHNRSKDKFLMGKQLKIMRF